MSDPSQMTPEALHQFLISAAAELERQLPELQIALDKIQAAKKISAELLQKRITI